VALAVRPTDDSRLPWMVRVASTNPEINQAEAAVRRRLLFGGLLMVLVLFGGSAYFALRGVSREVEAVRLQSDFVAAVSHEFRTPLASVRHLSEMLTRGRIGSDAERQAAYGFLSRESERLERLVEDVLDFGRIEGAAYEYRFDRIDVSDLLRTIVSEFQPRAQASGHRVDLSIADDPVTVRADREALARAIRNLLDNAVKYSPGADAVQVGLRQENGAIVIDVQDRGVGIADDERRAIFRKFVRGRNAIDRRIKGTGIGLAMVQQIMAAHRGTVRVESQPNQGSTFSLVLPEADGLPQSHVS
jgi:signal transduction histidine kinase